MKKVKVMEIIGEMENTPGLNRGGDQPPDKGGKG
jgi:hypothetical protein